MPSSLLAILIVMSGKPVAEPVAPRRVRFGTSRMLYPIWTRTISTQAISTDKGGENFGLICRAQKGGGLRGSCELPPLCAIS